MVEIGTFTETGISRIIEDGLSCLICDFVSDITTHSESTEIRDHS